MAFTSNQSRYLLHTLPLASGAIDRLEAEHLVGVYPALVYKQFVSVGGTLTFEGTLGKSVGLNLSGALTPSGTLTKGISRTTGGVLTFTGTLAKSTIFVRILDGILSFVGTLTGNNPDWLEIHPWQNWRGEWDATTDYLPGDVVLYQDGNYVHAFMSKLEDATGSGSGSGTSSGHNIGHLPTDSTYWTRVIQEGWRA